MRTKNRNRFMAVVAQVLMITLVFTGCADSISGKQEQPDTANIQQQDVIQQSIFGRGEDFGALLVSNGIELPVSTTKIFINQAGYIAERDKTVMFLGEQLGNQFRVIRKSDKEVVYIGQIENGKVDPMSGVYLSVGDFSEIRESGTYYIETDIVGQSYPFRITQDGYENMFVGMLKNVGDVTLTEDVQGICETSFGMHIIMYAMQCNGSLFEEAYRYFDEEERDKQLVTQLLYFARWMIEQQSADGSLYGDYEATAAFCGAMVMSRDVFGKYEASVAKEHKAAYDKAWKWLEAQECDTDVRKSARFYAVSQLFKAEYREEYKKIVEDFLKERERDYASERFVFYGVLAYATAAENTNRDLCTHVMKDLVDTNELFCQEAKNDMFFGTGKRTFYDNLYNMRLLCFVNYITPSKEYTEIVENSIQYMGGLNENGICYIDENGIWRALSETNPRSLEWNGILLFGMSDLIKNLVGIENT